MSLIDIAPERKIIENWTKEFHEIDRDYFFDDKKSTYYTEFDNSENMSEYDFQSFKDIEIILTEKWKEDQQKREIVKACSVAVMKGKPKTNSSESSNEGRNDSMDIPDYIYVF